MWSRIHLLKKDLNLNGERHTSWVGNRAVEQKFPEYKGRTSRHRWILTKLGWITDPRRYHFMFSSPRNHPFNTRNCFSRWSPVNKRYKKSEFCTIRFSSSSSSSVTIYSPINSDFHGRSFINMSFISIFPVTPGRNVNNLTIHPSIEKKAMQRPSRRQTGSVFC